MNGLSAETYAAITHTTNALVPLLKSLVSDRGLNFVLLGNISSDYLEQRFGWYRQLCGANYFNSVPQFLQAEKNIRLRNLVKVGFNIDDIKEIMQCQSKEKDAKLENWN